MDEFGVRAARGVAGAPRDTAAGTAVVRHRRANARSPLVGDRRASRDARARGRRGCAAAVCSASAEARARGRARVGGGWRSTSSNASSGRPHLGTTSTYLQGIDPSQIIDAVRSRCQPTISATAACTLANHRPRRSAARRPPPAAGGRVEVARGDRRSDCRQPRLLLESAAAQTGSHSSGCPSGDDAAAGLSVADAPTRDYDRSISFFDPLPEEPPPAPEPPRRPAPWMGPPDDVLPGIVALELSLVHSGRQVMWIAAAEVYPEGMAFSVLMCGRRAVRQGVEAGSGTWRFGVQFSDGRKATVCGVGMFSRGVGAAGETGRSGAALSTVSATTGAPAVGNAPGGAESPPDGPVLRARGGGGSRSAWRQQYWSKHVILKPSTGQQGYVIAPVLLSPCATASSTAPTRSQHRPIWRRLSATLGVPDCGCAGSRADC